MPGIILATDLDAAMAMQSVKKIARRLGYSLSDVNTSEVVLSKNAVIGIFLGTLFPTCHFRVVVRTNADKKVEIDIERNSPGVTSGVIGVNRVKSQAEDLASRIADDIKGQGGDILRRGTF